MARDARSGTGAGAGRGGGAGRLAGRVTGDTRPAVDASTVMLLRDGDHGLEVFMLERHLASDFAGGALAFPGGKVDTQDRDLPDGRSGGVDLGSVAATLGVADLALARGFLVAAVRETFEEAGVLLASRAGRPVTSADLATASFATARRRLAARDDDWDWRGWLEREQLVLELGALAPWSWWVTPEGMHRRYDTRFFVVRSPAAQGSALMHDDVETTDSLWIRPGDALARHEAGDAVVVYPTRKNLEALAAYPSATACWEAAAAGRVEVRRILPALVEGDDGQVLVQHPDGGAPEPG